MLLVVVVAMVLVMAVVFGSFPVAKSHFSLGVVQGIEVVVVAVSGVSSGFALKHHLQVGSDAMVTGAGHVAEVDDAALISALVGWFDPGEAEFVGDVASHDLHNLIVKKTGKQ